MSAITKGNEIKWIHTLNETGIYDSWVIDIAKFAREYIDDILHRRPNESYCAIFDIDDTLLSSIPFLLEHGYNFTMEQQHQWYLKCKCPVIQPILELYHRVLEHNIPIHLVSARCETLFEATVINLENTGILGSKTIRLRPKSIVSGREFKLIERQKIVRSETILINIGDQNADLVGSDALMSVKMPDLYRSLAEDGFERWR